MEIGKLVRLNRLFAHPSGRLCSIAVDHFIGYSDGLPEGLRSLQPALAAIAAGGPDAVTMHKGVAASLWVPYAGRIPLILQSTLIRARDARSRQIATAEDAIRLGADALAMAAHVHCPDEVLNLRTLARCVRDAARFALPVICHIYPLAEGTGGPEVSFTPEDVAWAVRCAVEAGADVVKAPYCGNVPAYADIVAACPVPLVAAGGPRAGSLEAALAMIAEVMAGGARGATIGRNVWGFPHVTEAVLAFKAVIHDGRTPQEALKVAGL